MTVDLASLPAALWWRALRWSSPVMLFDALLGQSFYRAVLIEQLEHANFDRGATVLELGCGPGALGAVLAPQRLALTGCDHSPRMLRRARSRRAAAYAALVPCDAHQLPFPDHSFCGAFCANLLHLLDDPVEVINEVARVLRPGAPLLIAGPDERFAPKAIPGPLRMLAPRERAALRLWALSGPRLGSEAMHALVARAPFSRPTIAHQLDDTMFSLRTQRN